MFQCIKASSMISLKMTRDSVIINVPQKVVQGNVFWTSVPISSSDSLRLLWILWVINREAKKLQINGIQFKRELMEHTLFHQLSPYFNGFVDYCQNNTDENFLFDLSKLAVFIQYTYLLSELITLLSDLRTGCSGRLCFRVFWTNFVDTVCSECVCIHVLYDIIRKCSICSLFFWPTKRKGL